MRGGHSAHVPDPVGHAALHTLAAQERTVEWLAALYRDQLMLPPEEALQRAQQAFKADWQDAEIRAERFAAMVQALYGKRVKPSDICFL